MRHFRFVRIYFFAASRIYSYLELLELSIANLIHASLNFFAQIS